MYYKISYESGTTTGEFASMDRPLTQQNYTTFTDGWSETVLANVNERIKIVGASGDHEGIFVNEWLHSSKYIEEYDPPNFTRCGPR